MGNNSKLSVTLCCGGGVDSTALMKYYLDLGYIVRGVHFDYGHPACLGERRALMAISNYYDVLVEYSQILPAISNVSETSVELNGRNALFVLSALNQVNQNEGLISLGIHAYSPYYDCSPSFVKNFQALLDGYYKGTVILDAPFLNFSKGDIFNYCREIRAPIELTHSCEKLSDQACGSCSSCMERNYYDSSK